MIPSTPAPKGHQFHPGDHYCAWCGIERDLMDQRECDENLIRVRPNENRPTLIRRGPSSEAKWVRIEIPQVYVPIYIWLTSFPPG